MRTIQIRAVIALLALAADVGELQAAVDGLHALHGTACFL